MKKFDVNSIVLSGNNLIEASAGTGKTYSIGLLALRLLLEKDIKIEEILMVTFTNSAVAELEIRIRHFLKLAQRYILNQDEIDTSISNIIDNAIKQKSKEEINTLLSNAILFLDETAIYTIHGFCQLTLSEFAFDTKQLFNTELIENQNPIIENAVNDFWRNEITVLDTGIIEVLKEKLLTRELLIEFSKNIFNGKQLSVRNSIDRNNILSQIHSFKKQIESQKKYLHDSIVSSWELIKSTKIHKGTKLYKSIAKGKEEFRNELLIAYKNNPEANYLKNLSFLLPTLENIVTQETTFSDYKMDVFIDFLSRAEVFIKSEVAKKKNRNQVLSFNDLIEKLHISLVKEDNVSLKQSLCNKYRAVFIDEFQDTDHLQYQIFHKAFIDNCDSIVFFIGDPKQSIYAWRGADLKTYIKAQNDIGENKFTMKSNFRSTSQLISAMNDFFPLGKSCRPGTVAPDPFCSEEIKYEKVVAGNNSLEHLINKEELATSFDIVIHSERKRKKDLFESAGMEIVDLLANHHLSKGNNKTEVKPKNICVLVRTRSETKVMKNVLNQYNIPAIIVDDTKIMETDEARNLFYTLYAIDKNDTHSISRALLSPFTAFSIEDIKNLNMDYYRTVFSDLQETWENTGIYSVILRFLDKFGVRNNLLDTDNPKGNRIYTNLMHLAEILNDQEFNNNFSPENLLDWFQKSREGYELTTDYEQRIESDDDAVEIMTIHKSKGLSFDIVVLPYLNLKIKNINNNAPITYLNDEGFFMSYHKTEEEKALYNFQNEQENRRLLYVAITRAVYKCIIHFDEQKGTLKNFVPNINSKNICIREPKEAYTFRYESQEHVTNRGEGLRFQGKLNDSWRLTSYTALDNHTRALSKRKKTDLDKLKEYDTFIFVSLKKGAQTGIILHSIFEKIDFTNDKYWIKEIEKDLMVFGRDSSEIKVEQYLELIRHTLMVELKPDGFSLSEVSNAKRFNELEFYFSFDKWNPIELRKIFPGISIDSNQIQGVMHGFIDLLFEYNGKFYILDWKSNHLGMGLEYYINDNIEEAMTENNYHLQYIVYTIAAIRFLENRITEFDYDKHFGGVYYLFLRGIRKDKDTGIFFNRLTKDKVEMIESMI